MSIVLDRVGLYNSRNSNTIATPIIDLKTGKLKHRIYRNATLYTPSDVKKLARAIKSDYMQTLQLFEAIGIDTKTGAPVYVARDFEEEKRREEREARG